MWSKIASKTKTSMADKLKSAHSIQTPRTTSATVPAATRPPPPRRDEPTRDWANLTQKDYIELM